MTRNTPNLTPEQQGLLNRSLLRVVSPESYSNPKINIFHELETSGINLNMEGNIWGMNIDTEELLRQILENGADVRSEDGQRALLLSAEASYKKYFDLILSKFPPQQKTFLQAVLNKEEPSDLDSHSTLHNTAFLLAALAGNLGVIKSLADRIDPENFDTAFLNSAKNGHADIVDFLNINGYANIDACDEAERTALNLASANGHLETIKYLLQHGANSNLPNAAGDIPIQTAISRSFPKIVEIFLDHDPNISERTTSRLKSSLSFNQSESREELNLLALKRGLIDISDDKTKNSLFIETIINGQTKVAEYLLENGADVNASDKDGKTALILAIWHCKTNSVKTLLNHNVDLHNSIAETIIHTNERNNYVDARHLELEEITNLILRSGFDLKLETEERKNQIVQISRRSKFRELRNLIIENFTPEFGAKSANNAADVVIADLTLHRDRTKDILSSCIAFRGVTSAFTDPMQEWISFSQLTDRENFLLINKIFPEFFKFPERQISKELEIPHDQNGKTVSFAENLEEIIPSPKYSLAEKIRREVELAPKTKTSFVEKKRREIQPSYTGNNSILTREEPVFHNSGRLSKIQHGDVDPKKIIRTTEAKPAQILPTQKVGK